MKKGFIRKIARHPVEEQRRILLEHLPEGSIYEHGRGIESLDALTVAMRGRKGEILIAADLRVLGESRKVILAEVDRLAGLNISIRDVAHPEDATLPTMLDRGLRELAGNARILASQKGAKAHGRNGGIARGVHAKERRHGNIDEDTARKVWTHPKLTREEKLWILGPSWTAATAHRQFGKSRHGS